MIKISVVVAIYNVEKYLEKCIQSIIFQTYKNIEIILVNDGSTDNSLNICKKYKSEDSRIIIINQENQGVSVARNNGIDRASGEYILFVDGDDYLRTDIIEKLLNNADDNDIIACAYIAFDDNTNLLTACHFFEHDRLFHEEKNDLYLQLINLSYCQSGKYYTAIGVPWGKLYKTSFLKKNDIYFHKQLIRMQDNIFNMQAFALANYVKYIDQPLYMYRVDNILKYKKLPYKPEYFISILHEREKIIKKFNLDKNDRIISFFKEEIDLSALKTMIYIARTENYYNFKKIAHHYLKNEIYSKYKNIGSYMTGRGVVINLYLKMGLNYVTYVIAKYIKY